MAEILRTAIRDSGKSALELSKLSGVPQTRISGFLRGDDMRLTSAHKLARRLGLALQPTKRK